MDTLEFEDTSLRHLRSLKERQGHRVLLVGNGISPEPYGFVHAGCDVTVVEVSAVACRFIASLEVTPDLLARMFRAYDETPISSVASWRKWNAQKSLSLVAEEYRPGGGLSVVNEDLFAYEPNQPFHAIFSRRAYQGFPFDRREELARRFFRWLHPGGIAFVEMQNIDVREPFEGPFQAAGFREVLCLSENSEMSPDRRVRFCHASG